MLKLRYLLPLIALVGGGWYFLDHYQVDGLRALAVRPRNAPGPELATGSVVSRQGTIRIATFNPGPLDQVKLNQRAVALRLVELVKRFDLVALQDLRARDQSVLVQLVELVNATGREYDFAVPPHVGREPATQYMALIFDRAALEIDRRTVCTVADSRRRFRQAPLVSSFRARGAPASEAFTFTVVNVHVDPNRLEEELDLLDDVFRAVRDDPRGEDDVILLGCLGADDRRMGPLARIPGMTWTLSGTVSTTRGTRLVDNLLFDRRATAEFTGRSGVLDLMRELNLSIREAIAVSEHLPVWAEFSVYEGGQSGHIAQR